MNLCRKIIIFIYSGPAGSCRGTFSHFKESSAIAVDENSVGEFTSYPSGHTVRAWSIAMALVAIDEAHYSGIVKVGLELGESRIKQIIFYVEQNYLCNHCSALADCLQ